MGEKKIAGAATEVLVSKDGNTVVIRFREWEQSGQEARLSETYSSLWVTTKTAAILLSQLEGAVPFAQRISGKVEVDEIQVPPSDDSKKVN